jgi:hypothetical protein
MALGWVVAYYPGSSRPEVAAGYELPHIALPTDPSMSLRTPKRVELSCREVALIGQICGHLWDQIATTSGDP